MSDSIWIILTGSLVAISCGLLGCFLILRKMAMVGDAISHAVLPGIVIAYLVSGDRVGILPLVGAAAVGLFAAVMIEWLYRKARLQTDASIGITFTWLFAIGVIITSYFSGKIDLDQECILYGEIAYVPLDLIIDSAGNSFGPRPFWILLTVLTLIVGFIIVGYRGLFLTTFDPGFAAALGISTAFWHYSLMGAVSLTTVVSFESVGAVLVVAFLVVLPATAYLLTDDFKRMLVITSILGVTSAIGGYYLALIFDGSIAGAMTIAAGVQFAFALFFSPSKGILINRIKAGDIPSTGSLSRQDFPLGNKQ